MNQPQTEPSDASVATGMSTSSVCMLIMLAALALVGGRIAVVRSATGEVPFLSANDRSRWATVASLVDFRTYRIDYFQSFRDPTTNRRTWQSIDRVRHLGEDGEMHDYSSKPPLLATLVAGVYLAIKVVAGVGIQQHTFYVTRLILLLVNLPMLVIMFACVKSLAWRYLTTDFARVFAVLSVSLGTLLTSFAISLNNHLPAAVASIVALWMLDTQARRGANIVMMFVAGAAVAFSVANELPSLAILPFWGLVCLRLSPVKCMVGFVPGMLVVAVAFFGTNWLAHQSLRPPYAHRTIGNMIETIDISGTESKGDESPRRPDGDDLEIAKQHAASIASVLGANAQELTIESARSSKWLRAIVGQKLYAVVISDTRLEIRDWDDWYDYAGTYWVSEKLAGVDRGEASQTTYAFHALIGHHGIFSLTPIWCLSLVGAGWWLWRRQQVTSEMPISAALPSFPWLAAGVIAAVSIVVLAFYLSRPQIDRNYGGVSSGLRWMLWLAPLWIYLAFPVVESLSVSKWGRFVCGLLLAASCFSVATSLENPWSHPWLYRWMDSVGWVQLG